jgi:hypothetical protein
MKRRHTDKKTQLLQDPEELPRGGAVGYRLYSPQELMVIAVVGYIGKERCPGI